jgi:hypothetical protein
MAMPGRSVASAGRLLAISGTTLLVVDRDAHGSPLAFGILLAVAFDGMFNRFGFTTSMGQMLANAASVVVRGRPTSNFHDEWDDGERLNAATAWQFTNGRLVAQVDPLSDPSGSRRYAGRSQFMAGVAGVNAPTFGGVDDPIGAQSRNMQLNRREIAALSNRQTLRNYGTMLPVSQRVDVQDPRASQLTRDLTDEYREEFERPRRAGHFIEPQYVRKFRNVATGAECFGVFGAEGPDDPNTSVYWSDI